MSDKEIYLYLPWPPSANNSKIPVCRAGKTRMVSSNALTHYHWLVFKRVRTTRRAKVEPPYLIELCFHAPDKRRRDIANFEKAVIDGLVLAGAIEDDHKIDTLILRRGDPYPEDPHVEVFIASEKRDVKEGENSC